MIIYFTTHVTADTICSLVLESDIDALGLLDPLVHASVEVRRGGSSPATHTTFVEETLIIAERHYWVDLLPFPHLP